MGPIPDINATENFDHPSWAIEIDGILTDPNEKTHLSGSKAETKTQEHQAWLMANGGKFTPLQPRDDGQLLPVPVEVTTTWDLRQTLED